ncbi:unnamed protein product [Ostreobium quekettii]|uniref:Uncharacterized protein n=1 Tax=Ostreobium quekettii TaxID=121088 RepID=A0A8S1JFW5_9CHLO|nr:unnamed protein product [Ostreobium quekettii]
MTWWRLGYVGTGLPVAYGRGVEGPWAAHRARMPGQCGDRAEATWSALCRRRMLWSWAARGLAWLPVAVVNYARPFLWHEGSISGLDRGARTFLDHKEELRGGRGRRSSIAHVVGMGNQSWMSQMVTVL